MLTSRERVLKAMHREIPDRVPIYADFSPGIYQEFLEKTGLLSPEVFIRKDDKGRPGVTYSKEQERYDPAEFFDYDVRIVEFGDTRHLNDYSAYLPAGLPNGRTRIGEWGIAYVRGTEHHFESMVHPLSKVKTIQEIENYPWPDLMAEYRLEIARQRIEDVHAKECASVGWPPLKGGTLFETAWGLRGFEELMEDMLIHRELAECLFDAVAKLSFAAYRFFAECGVDIIMLGDDAGMQDRMLMSPKMWREWLKPRYADLISSLQDLNPQLLIFFHSDGYIEPIIPDLIEIGVDILEPVQPESMDPAKIKNQYGDRLAFWGTIGTQTTLPFGNANEIKRVVKHRIETVGLHGGLLLAPTHKIQPDVAWENVLAFFEAVDEFGTYPSDFS
jgi:uroporphyrinogen decarboxylase